MRKLATILAAAGLTAVTALAAQAAEPNSTLATIISKGMVMTAQGMDFEVSFRPDGTFDAGLFGGKYTADGAKLCLEISEFGVTACSDYPEGKTSGDAFTVETEQGPLDVKIK